MTLLNRVVLLLIASSLILLMPYLGAQAYFAGNFPNEYFVFPQLTVDNKPGFSLPVFLMVAAFGAVIVMVYVLPRAFGFRPGSLAAREKGGDFRFPVWTWVGLVLWLVPLTVLWGKFSGPAWLINGAVVPMFWGFALFLDGIVFRRTGGRSIVGTRPRELLAMGLASSGGWMIFEWLNFFVDDNWLYPHGDLLSDDEFLLYALVGSSGLMVMSFEWYSLFNSWEGFRNRYANGPKVKVGRARLIALVVVAYVLLFLTPYFPNYSFGVLWSAPLVVLAATLALLDIWSPFRLIREGNWTPVLFLALTYFVQGVLCECWNYFSAEHLADGTVITVNPDYWVYSIPYVSVLHVFEMPLLGLGGYLPFGIYCGIWWIVFAFLFNIPTQFDDEGHYNL